MFICSHLITLHCSYSAVVLGAVNILLSLLIIVLKGTTVFQLSMALTNAVMSPVSGVFVAGILFPFLGTAVSARNALDFCLCLSLFSGYSVCLHVTVSK
jgi:hypothetical protein